MPGPRAAEPPAPPGATSPTLVPRWEMPTPCPWQEPVSIPLGGAGPALAYRRLKE